MNTKPSNGPSPDYVKITKTSPPRLDIADLLKREMDRIEQSKHRGALGTMVPKLEIISGFR